MSQKNRPSLSLENLEDRLTPAFTGSFNSFTGTWMLTQTVSQGDVTINLTAGNTLELTEGATTVNFGPGGNSWDIRLISGTGDELTVDLDSALVGNLTVNLGDGARAATIGGDFAFIGGNLRLTAGSGDHSITLGDNSPVDVGGSAYIDLGLGDDTVLHGTDLFVGTDLSMTNVNTFDDIPDDNSLFFNVGRNLNFTLRESVETSLYLDNYLNMSIGSGLTYRGYTGEDNVYVDGNTASFIGGNVFVDLSNQLEAGNTGDQDVDLSGTTIGGNVTIRSGFNQAGSADDVVTDALTVIGGSVNINLGGGADGDLVRLFGTVGGSSVSIYTGLGDDSITYGVTSGNPRVMASLGVGNDTFTVAPGAIASYMYIDFGLGNDVFDPQTAIFWPLVLRNLP